MDFGSQKTITVKTNYIFFSRMIPYLLQLVMAQDRFDIMFFLLFFVCFAVYKFSQLKKSKVTWLNHVKWTKVMHHRHPEACH